MAKVVATNFVGRDVLPHPNLALLVCCGQDVSQPLPFLEGCPSYYDYYYYGYYQYDYP